MWLPALGAALFLGAGLWWAVTPAAPTPAPEAAPVASAAAPTPPSPPTPVAAGGPQPMPRPTIVPPSSGAAIALPPGGNAAVQDHLRQLRQQLDAKGAGAAHR